MIHSCRTSFGFLKKRVDVDSDSSCPKMMAIQTISPQRLAILKKLIVAKISIVCSSVIVVTSLFRYQSPVCQVMVPLFTGQSRTGGWWVHHGIATLCISSNYYSFSRLDIDDSIREYMLAMNALIPVSIYVLIEVQ